MDQLPATLNDVILFLRGGGAVAIALALLIERWPWFAAQEAATKFVFAIALAGIGGALAYFLQGLTPQQATVAQQIWDLIKYVIGWLGTITVSHVTLNRTLPRLLRLTAPKLISIQAKD